MQMTIRNISAQVRGRLEATAKRRGVSLNQAAVDAIAAGLGVAAEPARKRDLSDIAGTMTRRDALSIETSVARSDAASVRGQKEDDDDRTGNADRGRHESVRRPRRRTA